MPCVPTVQTPSNKGFVGTVADYAPNISPMIPGIVIHCINEIERRGLSEVGIYRVNGSEKEIKDMKVSNEDTCVLLQLLDLFFNHVTGSSVTWKRPAANLSG